MHGGIVDTKLPARPNLEHLRSQAKNLLAQLKDGETSAAQAFIEHLPKARTMTAAPGRAAALLLGDAHPRSGGPGCSWQPRIRLSPGRTSSQAARPCRATSSNCARSKASGALA